MRRLEGCTLGKHTVAARVSVKKVPSHKPSNYQQGWLRGLHGQRGGATQRRIKTMGVVM